MKKILSHIYKSQAVRNSFWSTFEVLVLPVIMLVVTPFFLSKLGDQEYGQWVLINSIIASFGIVNMGLGDAAIRYIAKYRKENPARAVEIANTTYAFYAYISVLAFLLIMLYFVLETQFQLFFRASKNDFISLLKVATLLFVIRLIEQITFSIYKGLERFDLFSKFSICSKTLLIAANVIVVFLGYSLVTVIVVSVLVSSLFLIAELWWLKRFLRGFSILPKFNKTTFRETLSYGLLSWVQSIIGILGYQLDKFLVAGLAGVKVLAYYSIGFMVASQLFNLFVAASNWLFPRVSSNNMKGDELAAMYRKYQFILVAASCILISLFYVVKDPFLKLWLGDESYLKAAPFVDAYSVFILLTSLTIIPSYFTLGTSHMKLMTANSVLSLLATGITMFIGFNMFGAIGLVYGRICAAIISVPIFLLVFYKVVFGSVNRFVLVELILAFIFAGLLLADYTVMTLVATLAVAIVFVRKMSRVLALKSDLTDKFS